MSAGDLTDQRLERMRSVKAGRDGKKKPELPDDFRLPADKEAKYASLDPDHLRSIRADERHQRSLHEHGRRRGRHLADPKATGPVPAEPADMSSEERAIFEGGMAEGREAIEGREAERRERAGKRSAETAGKAKKRQRARTVRQGRRQLVRHAPAVAGAGTQLWHIAVVSLLMVGLYLALVNAKGVGTVVGGLQKAIAWLVSPTATI